MATTSASARKPPAARSNAKAETNSAPARGNATAEKTDKRPLSPDAIGEVAGEVWQLLDTQGPQPLAKVKKDVSASADLVLAALGWLAREGKLNLETSGKNVTVSLQ